MDTAAITFEPPGGGTWMLDVTHHGRRPVTRFLRPTVQRVSDEGLGLLAERYGLPVAGFRSEFVNGCSYIRVMGIGEPENPKGSPPAPLLWLVARLHPGMRKRARVAKAAWAERRWRQDVDDWFGGGRATAVTANAALQAVEPGTLDDRALLDHLADTERSFAELALRGFATHGGDLIPVGDLLAHCAGWGIDPGEAAALLAGASPASLETAELLAPVAFALAGATTPPATIEEVRALDPDADRAVSAWLDLHGWRLLFSDDLDSPTLAESPDLARRAVLAAIEPPSIEPPGTGPVRDRVPPEDRARFDELLAEARYGLRLRDDNVGVCWNWPAGLIRRALLEVGRRLVDQGRLLEPEHALDLDPAEVGPLLLVGDGPGAAAVADRWADRFRVEAAGPPLSLGPEEEPPPLHLLPRPLARAGAAIGAMIAGMQGEPAGEALTGTGVGTEPYKGRARVVTDPAAALATLEDGDVVVTAITGPAWNSLLPIVGALVVEEGGPMSHAAIVAREFAIPAVVGVTGATGEIPDGAIVEVDPAAGSVRLV